MNKNWKDEFGGQLQLWDKDMQECKKNIVPIFNRMVIFSTTNTSYHGNPIKVNHPNSVSRKSIAMYYYTNGRPNSENELGDHSTIFRKRPNTKDIDGNVYFKKIFGKEIAKIVDCNRLRHHHITTWTSSRNRHRHQHLSLIHI